MPSKLKKAIAAVKDQTSISLAKVKTTSTGSSSSSAASVEVAILKATTHDEIPINDHHVHHILRLVASNRSHASSCARALGRRISRTRNWAVALKSLLLVLRLFQDGDPHFPKEVLTAMKRGYKILNLSSFSASTTSRSPWDFTAFVRTFALYLDERLHCFLTGKLVHRRPARAAAQLPLDMKPTMLLDRISHWQRLLDRAIGTRPTGAARSNRLVQTCLYAVVQESFDLYRDISDGVALLLDSFFHLPHASCLCAYEACVKAARQFEELGGFYDICKAAGVGGRTSDYPSVMKMSEEVLDTLHDFLKDHNVASSIPSSARGKAASHLLPATSPSHSDDHHRRGRGTSLEDLIGDVSWDPQLEPDYKSYHSDPGDDETAAAAEAYHHQMEDVANDLASVMSDPVSTNYSAPDFVELDDTNYATLGRRSRSGWELALLEADNINVGTSTFEADFDGASFSTSCTHQYNPFLEDPISNVDAPATACNSNDYVVQPTFRADLHGDGNSSSVDLFAADFGNGDSADAGGVIDLFGDYDNGNANHFNGSGSFHAKLRTADSQVVSDASVPLRMPPSDEFSSLRIM